VAVVVAVKQTASSDIDQEVVGSKKIRSKKRKTNVGDGEVPGVPPTGKQERDGAGAVGSNFGAVGSYEVRRRR
jgi:hypothetical protein